MQVRVLPGAPTFIVIMLIDTFIFFNELDMLECRLDYLYDKVDKFILVEADITHSGKFKPYYFLENKERFKKYLDKILDFQIQIPKNNLDWNFDISKGFNNSSWQVENYHRNYIAKTLNELDDSSYIMISDLDEIPNKESIDRAKNLLKFKEFVTFETNQFYYNLGQCLIEPWPATVISKLFNFKKTTPQNIRLSRMNMTKIINGGWHLTYFGTAETIKSKIESFAHQEFNQDQFKNINYIKNKIENGEELYNRPFPMIKVDQTTFPKDFLTSFSRYKTHKINHFAFSVDGWFTGEDAQIYSKVVAEAKPNAHFVEIGSYKGRSSSFMAVEIHNSGKNIRFDCVDTWEGSEEHQNDQDVINRTLFEVFTYNMKPVEILYNAVRLPSLEAAKNYADKSLDFVFIDAAHDYENVYADISAWLPKVKSGGILSGHDWHHPPIKRAVYELIGDVEELGNCWFIYIK